VEGNTGPDGGRDGDGVYRKTRRWTSRMRGRSLPNYGLVLKQPPALLNGQEIPEWDIRNGDAWLNVGGAAKTHGWAKSFDGRRPSFTLPAASGHQPE
jgi:hypothetical protein